MTFLLFYLRLLAEEVELGDVVAVAALAAYPDSMNQQETNQSKKKRNSLPPKDLIMILYSSFPILFNCAM